MTKCYEHEECEFNGQPECRLPDGMECPHGAKADKPVAESKTDIEALIERLNQYSQTLIAFHMGGEFSDMFVDAATALSTLQAENEKMREELERVKEERDAVVESIPQYFLTAVRWIMIVLTLMEVAQTTMTDGDGADRIRRTEWNDIRESTTVRTDIISSVVRIAKRLIVATVASWTKLLTASPLTRIQSFLRRKLSN